MTQLDYILAGIYLLLALSWGLSNRGRGWGPASLTPPAWLVRLSEFCGRDTMAAWHGMSATWWGWVLGASPWPLAGLFLAAGPCWRLAVTKGWGEYQDGQRADNHEIAWIDWLVRTQIAPRLPVKYATDANVIDGIAMSFRGAYYLPMPLVAGLSLTSWWFAIPAAFFWLPGLVYFLLHRYLGPQSDVTAWVEWVK